MLRISVDMARWFVKLLTGQCGRQCQTEWLIGALYCYLDLQLGTMLLRIQSAFGMLIKHTNIDQFSVALGSQPSRIASAKKEGVYVLSSLADRMWIFLKNIHVVLTERCLAIWRRMLIACMIFEAQVVEGWTLIDGRINKRKVLK